MCTALFQRSQLQLAAGGEEVNCPLPAKYRCAVKFVLGAVFPFSTGAAQQCDLYRPPQQHQKPMDALDLSFACLRGRGWEAWDGQHGETIRSCTWRTGNEAIRGHCPTAICSTMSVVPLPACPGGSSAIER